MISLKQFFQHIKNLFQKKEANNEIFENKELEQLSDKVESIQKEYNEIIVGDIIWAKRYTNEEEFEVIPEGHREGPFIVLAIEDGNLFCSQGTGVPPYEKYSESFFYIDDINSNLKKPTYFNLIKLSTVDSNSFIMKLSKLKETDLNKLYRQIKVNHKTYYKGY